MYPQGERALPRGVDKEGLVLGVIDESGGAAVNFIP
jgi:hypothetical protein